MYWLGVCQLWKMLHERLFVQHRLCNLHFAWLCLIDKCVLFIFTLLSLNIYLYTICSPLNPCLHYNFTLIFKCVPQILGSSSIHIFRLLFLSLSITFQRIHKQNSFDLGAISFFCFKFGCLIDFLIPIVTWWVLNFSIKYPDLPARFAAFAGMLTSLLSVVANSAGGNIFSVMHPITKNKADKFEVD